MSGYHPLASGKRKLDEVEGNGPNKRHTSSKEGSVYWMVQWRKPQTKKHRTWDGDGVLVANRNSATLYDMDGKLIANGKVPLPLPDSMNIDLGGKELGLDRPISQQEYLSGACFGNFGAPTAASLVTTPKYIATTSAFKPLKPSNPPTSVLRTHNTQKDDPPIETSSKRWSANWRKIQHKKIQTWEGDAIVTLTDQKLVVTDQDGKQIGCATWNGQVLHSGYTFKLSSKEIQLDSALDGEYEPSASSSGPITPLKVTSPVAKKYVSPASFYATPLLKAKGPRHDQHAEGAVAMKEPTPENNELFNKHNFPIVPVVLDPILSKRMRPHQHEGVRFMYEAVMGMRKHEGQGCILADDMGLGKTLQTIALIWTLLKQNPFAGPHPVVSKVLIACPVTLINNWKSEFHKWLGRDRISVVVCDKDKKVVKTFINAKNQQVLIIGYERLRTVMEDLTVCIPPIGLIVCDEGHKLKSATNKTTSMFKSLRTPRRIILSGTPIQNDLGEFHTMADFCNPGLLDDYTTFRRVYETPIVKARSPDATAAEVKLGRIRSMQLGAISESFVLRRDARILQSSMPPKHEYVIFITPTDLQLAIFQRLLQPNQVDDIVQGSSADSLALIQLLTKVSNSPILLKATADASSATNSKFGVESVAKLLPEKIRIEDMTLSGKLTILSKLLHAIHENTDEKCVLVSHYTSTLNILEAYCRKSGYSYYRLDGQTPVTRRQEYVHAFNTSSRKSSFIFLLSSKAGGVGINLIGASRLCLLDCDWNPSHDLQSMARCHRDGQKRPVYIYRLMTAGTIDEKIYQRQVTKLGLSDSLMGCKSSTSKGDSFTRKELRDIFRIYPNTPCSTHELLECFCDQENGDEALEVEKSDEDGDSDSTAEPRAHKGFQVASQIETDDYSSGENDKSDRARKKAGLAALGEWNHLNCTIPTPRLILSDKILTNLIERQSQHRPDRGFFESLDQAASTDAKSPRALAGGTISFLFERTSTALLPGPEELGNSGD